MPDPAIPDPATSRLPDAWPSGTGIMAARIRAHDWSATSLGAIERWSSELRAATMLVLDTGFPAALVWGDSYTTIYNDGFLPIVDGKPDALGRRFDEIWVEDWDRIAPAVRRAYAGEGTFIKDHLLVIERGGRPEQAYFTFSYSPVRHADGSVAGMIDLVMETTTDVAARHDLQENERRYRALVAEGRYLVFRMNADWRAMYTLDGQTLATTTDPIENWIDVHIPGTDQPAVIAAIHRAIDTKSLFELEHRVRLSDGRIGWVLSRAVPLLDAQGEIAEWFGTATEVTERRAAADTVRSGDERYARGLERQIDERSAELDANRTLLQATMDASPDMIEVFAAVRDEDGRIVDFVWRLNNRTAAQRSGEARGESLLARNPDVVARGLFDAFKRVVETGQSEQTERHDTHERSDCWFLQTIVRLGDGVATTTKDITQWKREQDELFALREEAAQAMLRESEERLRQYGEASQDVLWIRDARTLQWQYLTPAFETIYGVDRNEALAGDNLRSWLRLIVPDDRVSVLANIGRVRRGEKVTFDFRVRRPVDGTIRWLRETDFPIMDEAGRVVRVGGIGHDITELKATEQALAAAEIRQRVLIEGIPQLVWRAVAIGQWTWASPQWTRYTGQADIDSHDWKWLDVLHPDDRAAARAAWATAHDSGGFEVEYRIFHEQAGDYRWFTTRATAVRADDGRIVEWLGTSTEIDQLRTIQARQQVLVTELQHRTRNLIAVVRSLADKTLSRATDLPDFQDRFDDRLGALARVQGLLSRLEQSDRVTFDELLGTALDGMGILDGDPGRVVLNGPKDVRLRSRTVQTLAMALHELSTNAVKYGALSRMGSQLGARLAIRWQVERHAGSDRPLLRIEWRESGVAMPRGGAANAVFGQGRELIERALPYQLEAETRYELRADGVYCMIAIPVSASVETRS